MALLASVPRIPGFSDLRYVERVCIHTIHFNLGEHREGDAVIPSAELLDLRFAVRLLVSKLITGKPEHHEPLSLNLS